MFEAISITLHFGENPPLLLFVLRACASAKPTNSTHLGSLLCVASIALVLVDRWLKLCGHMVLSICVGLYSNAQRLQRNTLNVCFNYQCWGNRARLDIDIASHPEVEESGSSWHYSRGQLDLPTLGKIVLYHGATTTRRGIGGGSKCLSKLSFGDGSSSWPNHKQEDLNSMSELFTQHFWLSCQRLIA